MRKVWIVGLVLLLAALAGSASALEWAGPRYASESDNPADGWTPLEQAESTSAEVRVIPAGGDPGSTHTIIITGLQVGEEITVRIRQDATGQEMYTTTRTAEDNARVQFDIFTTQNDVPGTYTVEAVSRSGQVLGSATLTITEIPGRNGVITVTPDGGEAGSTFAFDVSAIRPFADLEFIVRDAAGVQVFSLGIRATVDGTATVSYPSDPGLTGPLTVVVLDNGEQVATTTFTVVEQIFAVDTVITPEQPHPLDEVFVTLSGLTPDVPVQVQILKDDALVSSAEVTGDGNGLAIFSFMLERDIALGDYEIRVLDGETLISRTIYNVDMPELVVSVTPTEGLPGTRFAVDLSGLLPEELVTVEIFGNGAVIHSSPVVGSQAGTAQLLLGQRITLEPGAYTIRVLRGESIVFSTPVTIVTERTTPETSAINPETVIISVDPLTGPALTDYTLRVEGVPPGTSLTLAIVYDGRAVLTLRGDADENGIYETVVTSEETDPPGTYTLEVRADGELIGSTDFGIAVDAAALPPAEATAEPTAPPADGVTIAIEPDAVARGEQFTVTVNGLQPGETALIELLINNSSVFVSERAADANGTIVLLLRAEASDQAGMYSVLVIRTDGSTVEGAFTILESGTAATPPPPVSGDFVVVVTPAQGTAGTTFQMETAGFATGVRVDVEIRYNGEVISTSQRNADVNGVVRLNIPTTTETPQGEYQVTLLQGGAVVATGSYIIGEGSAAQPTPVPTEEVQPTLDAQPAQVTIVTDPVSGPVGTNHTITVSGLTPGAEISFDVRFAGSSVYTTGRTADTTGSAVLVLVTQAGDPAGIYEVIVTDSGSSQIGSTQFTLESGESTPVVPSGGEEVSITVQPDAGSVGTMHEIVVSGLEPGTEVLFDVLFGDNSVYRTSRTADEAGNAVVVLVTQAGDPEGIYDVIVSDASGTNLGSVQFTLTGTSSQPTPEPTQEAQTAEVSITIEPQSGPVGTSHTVTVSGLAAAVEVLFDVRYDGSSVYRTTRITASDGSANVTLVTQDGDPAGVYEVLVSTGADGVLGSVQFTLEGATAQVTPEPIEPATPEPTQEPTEQPTQEPVSATGETIVLNERLSENAPEYQYSFEGEAGSTIVVRLNSSDFDTYLRLADNNGNELSSNDDSNSSLNSQIGPFTLPYTGSYTITATSYPFFSYGEATVGDFELIIERAVLSQIAYGETRRVEMNEQSFSQFLRFNGSAGDVIAATVDSGGSIDTVLSIIDPNGATVFEDDDSGSGFDPEVLRYVLPFAGEYTIVLRAFTPGTTGEVDITLTRSDTRSLDTDTRSVHLSSKQTQDVLTLQGSAGETISLHIDLVSGDVGNLTIMVDQANVQLMYYNTSGMPASIVLGFEVPQDGDVTIRVEDYSTAGSTLEFSIQRD